MRNIHWRIVGLIAVAGTLVGWASGDWRFGAATILALLAAIYGVRSDK